MPPFLVFTGPSSALSSLSLQCCHSLNIWLNEPSHSTCKSVKCPISKADPHRYLKTVVTSPISDTNSPTTEHGISSILRCRQYCSNTVQAAGCSIPSRDNWSTNLGQVWRAAIYLQWLQKRRVSSRDPGSADVNAVLAEWREGRYSLRDAVPKADNWVRVVHICYTRKAAGSLTASLDSAFFGAGTSLSRRSRSDYCCRRQSEGSVKRSAVTP